MTETKHTPGPWGWFGDNNGIYLATKHSGRLFVMGFTRRGMQGAGPLFRVGPRMVSAGDLVKFEVGDGSARGFPEGKKNPTVYRYDITEIDHPDARLIAAAPELLAALIVVTQTAEILRDHLERESDILCINPELVSARQLIAKVKGGDEGRAANDTARDST